MIFCRALLDIEVARKGEKGSFDIRHSRLIDSKGRNRKGEEAESLRRQSGYLVDLDRSGL
jgi:hypothetical protein